MLKEGYKWRIGDGSKIRIWKQPWLREGESLCLQSEPPSHVSILYVKDIVHPGVKAWNQELINSIFPPEDAHAILKVPLLNDIDEDQVIWKLNRNGLYSVRSAYHLCVEKLICANHLKVQGDWSLIWQLKVPSRVKNCLWRACRDVLPTRICLQGKGVQCPMTCVCCEAAVKNSFHLFFTCGLSMQCWKKAGLW